MDLVEIKQYTQKRLEKARQQEYYFGKIVECWQGLEGLLDCPAGQERDDQAYRIMKEFLGSFDKCPLIPSKIKKLFNQIVTGIPSQYCTECSMLIGRKYDWKLCLTRNGLGIKLKKNKRKS
jgi:hypothetical protein